MRKPKAEQGEGRLGCFLWLVLAGLIVYGAVKIIPVRLAASRYGDFIAEEAAFSGFKHESQIIRELLDKARELELPVSKEQLEVTRTRESITIAAHYQVPVEFFGQFRFVFRFDPEEARPVALP